MRGPGKFLSGILAGIGLAYLLDPDRGARRRALVRDKTASVGRRLASELDATTRDLRNRAKGSAAELAGKLRRESVDDATLLERVRSAIGHVLSHPGVIDLDVANGRVTIRGPVSVDEKDRLITTARGVRGVVDVIDQTIVHATHDDVPALQGEGRRPG